MINRYATRSCEISFRIAYINISTISLLTIKRIERKRGEKNSFYSAKKDTSLSRFDHHSRLKSSLKYRGRNFLITVYREPVPFDSCVGKRLRKIVKKYWIKSRHTASRIFRMAGKQNARGGMRRKVKRNTLITNDKRT